MFKKRLVPGTSGPRVFQKSQKMSTHTPPAFLWILPVGAFLFLLLPLIYLGIRASGADLTTILGFLVRRRNGILILNTLVLTVSVLGISLFIGLPLAWITERTDFPGKSFITLLGVLPLTIPGYVMAYALLSLGGNYGVAARVFGIAIPRLSGLSGASIALSLYTFPYLYMNIRTALRGLDPGLEESARSFGYSGLLVFVRVVLPQLWPAFLSGSVVIILYVLGDFGVVALMRYEVFSYAIFVQYSGAFDRAYPAVLSLMLVGISLFVLFAEGRLLRSIQFGKTGAGAKRRVRVYAIGRWKWVAGVFVFFVVLFSTILPIGILVYWIGQVDWIQSMPGVFLSLNRSFFAAFPAAILAVFIALPTVYLANRFPTWKTKHLERSASLGYGIPPIALALGFVFFSLRALPFLYQSLTILILAYSLNFLALAMGPIRAALLQTPRRIEEAARALGYNAIQAFLFGVLPSLWKGIIASGIIVFVMVMKELPITILLSPTGYTTLATAVFSRTSEAMYAEAAPFAGTIILFSSIFVGLIIQYEGKSYASP